MSILNIKQMLQRFFALISRLTAGSIAVLYGIIYY